MKLTISEAKRLMEQSGGSLYLSGTGITSLPEGLTVGDWLDLRGTGITRDEERKVKKLQNGDYVENKYLYADGILTHIKTKKEINGYTFYTGKIKWENVISDGTHYAHCKNFKKGVQDIEFKKAKGRGVEQYQGLHLESEISKQDAITMYRVITGACEQGTEKFVNSLKDLKEKYTIREIIQLTKGQYNSNVFAEFFN